MHARTLEQANTAQRPRQRCDTRTCTVTRRASGRPTACQSKLDSTQRTLDSRFFSRFRKSSNSGEVINIMLSLTTIKLANSRSYHVLGRHTQD